MKSSLTTHNHGGIMEGINTLLSAFPALEASDLEAVMEKAKKKYVESRHTQAIYQGKHGRYVTAYRDASGNRKQVQAKTQEELTSKLYEIYLELENRKTVADVYQEIREEHLETKDVSPATVDRLEVDYKRFFVKYSWDSTPLGDITMKELEAFIRRVIAAEELTSKGYAHFKNLLYEIIRRGHRDGYTDISAKLFFDDFKAPKLRKVKKADEEDVFTDAECRKLLPYLKANQDMLNDALLLDFYTGLRVGELTALKKSDFEKRPDGCFLHIQRTETKIKGAGVDGGSTVVVDHPKTDAGDRRVYLCDEALEAFDRLMNDPLNDGSEWLLIGKLHHNRVVRSSIRRRLSHVCNQVGVPVKSPHKIRKTYATHLVDAGTDVKLVMTQMGHADIKTTLELYYKDHVDGVEKARQYEKAGAQIVSLGQLKEAPIFCT